MVRNILNQGCQSSNVVITNNYVARLPIEQTQATSLDPVYISLKGLSTLSTADANKVIKVNSAGNALEYATDNNDPSKWETNSFGGNTWINPLSTTTKVSIGTNIQSSPIGKMLFVDGGADIDGELKLDAYSVNLKMVNGGTAGDSSDIWFQDSSATGTNNGGYKISHYPASYLGSSLNFYSVSSSGVSSELLYYEYNQTRWVFKKNVIFNIGLNTILLPTPATGTTGTLALQNSNIAFGDLGSGATSISYIYDPSAGTLSTTNNALAFHSNGTEVDLNCRVAAGGTSSAVNFKFAGNTLWRFNENLTMDVGSNAYSFPSSGGTLALVGGTSNWKITSTVYEPLIATNNKIKLTGTDTFIYGSITNPHYTAFGYINIGCFHTTYSANQYTDTLTLVYHGPPYKSVALLCSVAGQLIQATNTYADYFDINNSFEWRQDAGLSGSQRIFSLISPIYTGSLSYCCAFINSANTTTYPIIKNDNGSFILNMRGVGDMLTIETNGDTSIAGDLTIGSHTRFYSVGTTANYLDDPNSSYAGGNDYKLYWNTDSTVTIVNCGDPAGSTNLYVGGIQKLFVGGLQTHSSQTMSIDGYFKMGYDINGATSTINLYQSINHGSGSTSSATFLYFLYAGTGIGEVYQVNTSSVAYSTTSDYRLKDDIVDCGSILDTIDKMNVKEYSFKADKEENIDQKHIGFLAHEVQELDERFNTFVSGKKDEIAPYCPSCHSFNCNKGEACMECDEEGNCLYPVIDKVKYQSIDYGKLTPICIKGIQELHTIIKSQQIAFEKAKAKQIQLESELDTYKSIVDKLINAKSFVDFKKLLL